MLRKTCMILALAAIPLVLAPAVAQAEPRHGLKVSDHRGDRHHRGERDHHGARGEHRRHAGHRDHDYTRIYIGSFGRHGYRDHHFGHRHRDIHHGGHGHHGKGHHGKRHYFSRHSGHGHHRPYSRYRGWGLFYLD